MRALEPVCAGQLQTAGFQIGYEVFGRADAPPVLLLPPWQIVHSRIWKMQVPFLARHFEVITLDTPGNGGGERTLDPGAYGHDRAADQAAGLLDHLQIPSAAVVGLSSGVGHGLMLAARYPERVSRLALISGTVKTEGWPAPEDPAFWEPRKRYAGWEKVNAHYWCAHYADWLHFFFSQCFSEPHSTKAVEDACGWGAETTPEILLRTVRPAGGLSLTITEILARVRCPVLLIHGDADQICPLTNSQSLAAARPEWEFVVLAGAGHAPTVRDPVRLNGLLFEFLIRS